MSIFSNIRKSRQQAKEYNAKIAEEKKRETAETVPYRHVPTHAATDAFASAPPSWREATDRPKVIEQNRRRSAMAASGHHMNMPAPNFPRVASSLSFVSYPGQSSPRARMPRAYSYNGVSPYPDGSRDIIYSIPDVAHSEPECLKEESPLESHSDSAGSQEELEMRNSTATAILKPAAAAETVHRLHPSSRPRRTSDASFDRRVMTTNSAYSAKNGPSTSRDSRPPPSTRGFNAIPASAVAAPLQVGTAFSPLAAAAIAPTVKEPHNQSTDPSCQNSSSSSPRLTPNSTKHPSPSAPASPSPTTTTPPSDFSLNPLPNKRSNADVSYPAGPISGPATSKLEDATDGRAKVDRFTEVESPESEGSVTNYLPNPVSHAEVVNFFPEPAEPILEFTESKRGKGKRLSKGGGKLLKKSRRSVVEASA